MKYKDVIEGFEPTPSEYNKEGMKKFLEKNKYAVGVAILVAAGLAYYYYSKKKQQQ
jgi:hypothetical protein